MSARDKLDAEFRSHGFEDDWPQGDDPPHLHLIMLGLAFLAILSVVGFVVGLYFVI